MTTFGVIIYHESMGYQSTTTEEKQEIVTRCSSIGNRIDLFTQARGWVIWDLGTKVKEFTQLAKDKHMYVKWTLRHEGYPDVDWETLVQDTLAVAQDAQTHGVDELSVGVENGFRLSIWTQDMMVDAVLNLIGAVKNVYSGIVSYNTSGWQELDAWITKVNDPRMPQKLHLNIYEPIETYKSRIDLGVYNLGSRLQIGEFGGKMNLAGEEDTIDGSFQERLNYIISKGIKEAWCFDYKELDTETTTISFGLWASNNQPKPSWYILLSANPPPPPGYAFSRFHSPIGLLPAAAQQVLFVLRDKLIKEEVHRKIHPLV